MHSRILYKTSRYVHMEDTDMTGSIYFTSLQKYALIGFEEYLFKKKIALKEFDLAMPIVHVEADYYAPIHFGEKLSISVELMSIGKTSFITKTSLYKENGVGESSCRIQVGNVQVTHVLFNSAKKSKIMITENYKKLLFV